MSSGRAARDSPLGARRASSGQSKVLFLSSPPAGIASEMSVWDGVVVSALEKAYEKPPEKPQQEEDGDDMDADDDPMETVET